MASQFLVHFFLEFINQGIKKAATLVRFSKTEKEADENGKMVSKPIYFSVFDIKDVMARKAA